MRALPGARMLSAYRPDWLRRDLVARGRHRLRELTQFDASIAMLEAIGEVV